MLGFLIIIGFLKYWWANSYHKLQWQKPRISPLNLPDFASSLLGVFFFFPCLSHHAVYTDLSRLPLRYTRYVREDTSILNLVSGTFLKKEKEITVTLK